MVMNSLRLIACKIRQYVYMDGCFIHSQTQKITATPFRNLVTAVTGLQTVFYPAYWRACCLVSQHQPWEENLPSSRCLRLQRRSRSRSWSLERRSGWAPGWAPGWHAFESVMRWNPTAERRALRQSEKHCSNSRNLPGHPDLHLALPLLSYWRPTGANRAQSMMHTSLPAVQGARQHPGPTEQN